MASGPVAQSGHVVEPELKRVSASSAVTCSLRGSLHGLRAVLRRPCSILLQTVHLLPG